MPQLVDECLEGMRRVRSTTGELRQFSRAEDSEPEEVQLAELMDSSLVLASSEIRYRAQVIKDYQPVPSLVVYRSKLAQVFLNIVVNAAQAIETGGVEDNWIRVSTGRDGGGIYAEIANSGSVIPPEVSRRIFDPFFTTKRRDKGTGLGLAIAMSTVQQHRGQISVRSDEHTGTVFRVWLPLDTGLQVERRATVRVSGERERACRILVVEDERYILNFMRRLLSKRHEVQTASGGREAMDLLARDRAFDLIFCDLMMPEIGGIDVYEWVTLEYPDLADRFVFMTGGAFTPRGRGFVQRMGDRVLQKPVGAAQLLEAVQHYASTH